MFMFRSRRATLTKRLLRARQWRRDDDAVQRLLKQLQDNQLEMLWAAVESGGRDAHSCVLLPTNEHHVLLCCRTWRWPDDDDLLCISMLRRLPDCRSLGDPVYTCCNPFHWSRVFQPNEPPHYRPCVADRLEDRTATEDAGSLTTQDSCRNPLEWCKLAYWELAQRVGPLYPVESPAVNVFGDVPYCDGLSLDTLAQQNGNAPESVRHGRCKIGLGVTLSHEGDSVWIYNRSENPIFVNALALDGSPLPTRVPAEQCLCVFDAQKPAQSCCWPSRPTGGVASHGPIDPNSIRISFAKGWGGSGYKRQEITACPCWLEVLLAPCR